ncbi:MAG: T9SS type A sorting domain-containing protein [Bacteroidota bacterium]
MKSFTLSLAFLFIIHLASAEHTLYSTGLGDGNWDDPLCWKDENGVQPAQAPQPDDHVVINHYLTHFIEGDYTHHGNITIGSSGVYEIFSFAAKNSRYIYQGNRLMVAGSMVATLPLELRQESSHTMGMIYLAPQGHLTLVENLYVSGGLYLERGICGSLHVYQDLYLEKDKAQIWGQGRIIVEGAVSATENGVRLENIDAVHRIVERQTSKNISFYRNLTGCADLKGQSMTGEAEEDLTGRISAFAVVRQGNQVQIDWTSTYEWISQSFIIERSTDGKLFETIGEVEASGTHFQQYTFIDSNPSDLQVFYRVRHILESGDPVYSAMHAVSPTSFFENSGEIIAYPNPVKQGEALYLDAKGWTPGAKVKITIKNLMGQTVHRQTSFVDGAGNATIKVKTPRRTGNFFITLRQGDRTQTQQVEVQ